MPKKQREKIIVNRVKVVLVEKGISNLELARMINKTPNTISRICTNQNQPSLLLLREIALALDVDISELLVRTKKS